MKRTIIRLALIACVVALCCGAVFGCSASNATSTLTEAQQANREYMQKVNTIMASFDTLYTNMASAIASGDAEAAKQCVDSASETLESLKSLNVPEALADIQTAYVAAGEKLVTAVNDYYELYTGGTDANSLAYKDKIAQIQSLYNEGIEQLKAGDSAASAKE